MQVVLQQEQFQGIGGAGQQRAFSSAETFNSAARCSAWQGGTSRRCRGWGVHGRTPCHPGCKAVGAGAQSLPKHPGTPVPMQLIVIKVHALHIITHPQDAVRLRRGVGEVAGQLRARDVHRGVERKPAHVGVAGLLLQACRTEDGRASVARLLARAADGWEPAGLCGATSLIQAHAVMTAQATQLCAARSSDARIEQATKHAMQQCGAPALGCCA